LDYARNPPWHEWFHRLGDGHPGRAVILWWALRAWGVAILLLQAVFSWCTVCFGLRYSNLSYRGVIVDWGPYAVLKHPAYASKIAAFGELSSWRARACRLVRELRGRSENASSEARPA
jgi:protein-S-isoprenylcysteine O-methyltransferase Ste14